MYTVHAQSGCDTIHDNNTAISHHRTVHKVTNKGYGSCACTLFFTTVTQCMHAVSMTHACKNACHVHVQKNIFFLVQMHTAPESCSCAANMCKKMFLFFIWATLGNFFGGPEGPQQAHCRCQFRAHRAINLLVEIKNHPDATAPLLLCHQMTNAKILNYHSQHH